MKGTLTIITTVVPMKMKSTTNAILLALIFAAFPVHSAEKPAADESAEKPTTSKAPVTKKSKIKGQDGHGPRVEPTHADVSYGEHIRHKFDLWLPEGKSGPVPVHVYFHGGGFVGGRKTDFDPRPYLNAGFAAVSGSYRLLDGVNTSISRTNYISSASNCRNPPISGPGNHRPAKTAYRSPDRPRAGMLNYYPRQIINYYPRQIIENSLAIEDWRSRTGA